MDVPITSKQSATLGIYFHVPFCPHLCPYCDFVKTDRFRRSDVVGYFAWMLRELDLLLDDVRVASHDHVTVYFGGGTPGLFWGSAYAPLIARIAERFVIDECTIEANPWMLSREKLSSWHQVGFDRVTLGAQGLNDEVFRFLGRPHRTSHVEKAIHDARHVGFNSIQLDVIYGLPRGSANRFIAHEIERAVDLGVTGVSAYALTIEARTEFARNSVEPSDDGAADEYTALTDVCQSLGLAMREVSNFSKFECKHNNIYWYGHPYLGVGAGAHGLFGPGPYCLYGERFRYGPAQDGDDRRQLTPGRDEIFGASSKDLWLCRTSEGPRTAWQHFTELSFTLLRTPHGLPGPWLSQLQDAGTIRARPWSDDPLLAKGLSEGQLLLDGDGGLRLNQTAWLFGDYWHRHVVRVLEP
jgi:oxygen-independent coproporphyrinogen-3 oxidase